VLQVDVQLKLRVANGAARHAAFLCALPSPARAIAGFSFGFGHAAFLCALPPPARAIAGFSLGFGSTALTRSARDPTHDAGMHTAMVYVMALSRLRKTDACIGHAHVLPYLEQVS
tara:strand:+ start:440 stop:784 length:345 start_codon:yes stop_codon:yes gene_type:complete